MKLKVSRTSAGYNECPVEGAVMGPFIRVDIRNVGDPKKLRHGRDDWYERGRNHRVINGMIARDFDDQDWFIEIPDLQSLIEFIEKNEGRVVIWKNRLIESIWEIEIYDSWRE